MPETKQSREPEATTVTIWKISFQTFPETI